MLKFDRRDHLRPAMPAMRTILIILVLIASQALAGAPAVLAVDPDSSYSPAGVQPGSDSAAAPQQALPDNGRPESGALLQDRFGVTLGLLAPWGGGSYRSFNPSTFAPTLNTETADWIEADWYGNWSAGSFNHTTIRGSYPSGGEWYDVEAIYFDNDATNFYIAIVSSTPHLHDWGGGHVGVGIYETRNDYNVWIRPGDISLNLVLGAPRQERNGTTWHYNLGIDITHDDRDTLGNTVQMHDADLGAALYRTAYDLGGSDVKNSATSDWYTSGPGYNVTAYWEHTNFDPLYSGRPAPEYLGETTTAYYEYSFGGLLENNAPTYVYEVTVPRALLGSDNPDPGDTVGIQFVSGCRNDGDSNVAIVELTADVDDIETGDAPDSTNHAGIGMSNHTGEGPGSAHYPTVADTTPAGGGGPAGMCHAVTSSGLRLGATVSAESDADQLTDEDGVTNLDPTSDIPDRDSDDGLTFPLYWIDGTPALITYTVTAPASAAAGDRYVNIWVDWNRDGDWADDAAACVHGTRDEHVLVNQVVNVPGQVAPGTTAAFPVQVNPCQPILMDRAWVRITLSDTPISDANDDGRGPGYCFAEGETEDYLYDPTLEFGDAPDSTNNDGQPMTAYSLPGGAVWANFPTVANPAVSGFPGPCHIQQMGVTPILGSAVTVENTDADRMADADPLFNILPLVDDPDNDGADDGLILPVSWQDGTPLDIQYVVTMPDGGAAVPWYVNVWFDWNRDGDWDDNAVTCRNAHTEDERVVANQAVTVAPGSSQEFTAPINPCNPGADNAFVWIRITLSNAPLAHSDGSGPGVCMYGGETEDYYRQFEPTAVDLKSFTATPQAWTGTILLEWETVSEVDNLGFDLYRAESPGGRQIKLNDSLIPSQGPGSPMGYVYSFVDRTARPGRTYYYWLEALDIYGQTERYGPVSALIPLQIGLPKGRP
ncbi:MAG: hypothetical protein JXM73_17415 [Anaerolineae bacterium]|nr:hypothetical protein [Anaerolineae bacterium]